MGKSILKIKGHDGPLVMVVENGESGFRSVSKIDPQLPKSRLEVKFGEHKGVSEVLEQMRISMV